MIVNNLRHTLEELKVSEMPIDYLRLVESVVVGPALLRAEDVAQLLGVSSAVYSRARSMRRAMVDGGLRPSWVEGMVPGRGMNPRTKGRWARSSPERRGQEAHTDLQQQFQLFSRFGEPVVFAKFVSNCGYHNRLPGLGNLALMEARSL